MVVFVGTFVMAKKIATIAYFHKISIFDSKNPKD